MRRICFCFLALFGFFLWAVLLAEAAEAGAKVIGRDGNFEKYANGVVRDTRTGLEWVAGPDRKTSWYEAKDWVQNLNIDGGGWRMPTTKELKTLYDEGKGKTNRYMTPLLKTTGWWVWAGDPFDDLSWAWFFGFSGGRVASLPPETSASYLRAFAVRSRK